MLEGGERVSMASYGLNHYQHLHKAAFLGCANLDGTTIGHWRTYCELNGWDWRERGETASCIELRKGLSIRFPLFGPCQGEQQ